MGAMGEAILAYTQTLVDNTDGSMEQLEKAMALGQLCWNISVLHGEKRQSLIESLRESLSLDDLEFEDFHQNLLTPMIRRHEQMFPQMHQPETSEPGHRKASRFPQPSANAPEGPTSQPGKYDPCPCNSGKKFKFCCGAAARA